MDVLVVGGGPAALGILVNALRTNRYSELMSGDGLAIIDAGSAFGGGALCEYGINSNTKAYGFYKCILKPTKHS